MGRSYAAEAKPRPPGFLPLNVFFELAALARRFAAFRRMRDPLRRDI